VRRLCYRFCNLNSATQSFWHPPIHFEPSCLFHFPIAAAKAGATCGFLSSILAILFKSSGRSHAGPQQPLQTPRPAITSSLFLVWEFLQMQGGRANRSWKEAQLIRAKNSSA
jgi:hypothetical protein